MGWLRRIHNAVRSGRVESDIDREVSFHVAESVDELRAQGISEEEALRRARRRFGNITLQAERTRDADVAGWMDALLRNVRHGGRALARTPALAITIVLILALGIGANGAVFAALDAVLLQPLPFPDGNRLMRVTQKPERTAETAVAPVRLEDWNRLNSTFQTIAGYYVEDVSETSGEFPERVRRSFVTPRFLETWRVSPALGRDFAAGEYHVGGPRAALISDRYWRRRFDRNPAALDQPVRIAGLLFPIVGVMPASFLFPDRDVDVWLPSPVDSPVAQNRQAIRYIGIGRLKPEVTVEQARLDLRRVQESLAEEYPKTDRAIAVEVMPLKDVVVGRLRGSLWLVFGAVTTLLLIACTNIAALLLSRANHRRKETAIRVALGASRKTIIAQAITETGMLALAGAALGVLVASAALSLFRRLGPDLPRLGEIALTGRFFGYTLATALAVTVACGVLPAVRGTATSIVHGLGETARGQVSTRHGLQWLLVCLQVSLSVTLLTTGGLLLRSFQELSRVSPGFDPRPVLTFRISGTFAETADYAALLARIERRLDELRALPGVEDAATSSMLPGVPAGYESTFALVGGRPESEPPMIGENRFVSTSYFATMKIPVLSGELCRRRPLGGGTDVMVNSSFASGYLSGTSAVGRELADPILGPGRIVGIVGDARERGINSDAPPTVYWCFSAPTPTPAFLVRARGEAAALVQPVREKITELEPGRAVYDVQPLEQRIGDAFAQDRLRTLLVVLFAITALSLACVGLYGTLSYTASLRRREVGLRLALGAMRGVIVRQLVSRSLLLVAVACAGGIALSAALARALSGMLYGVSPSDPVTLSAVTILVLALAGLASLVPSARVAFLDPVDVLRDE
jgi:putative ABC transport system permease protein